MKTLSTVTLTCVDINESKKRYEATKLRLQASLSTHTLIETLPPNNKSSENIYLDFCLRITGTIVSTVAW